MSDLLKRAFGALGPAPSWREVELVAETLRISGDKATTRALEGALADRKAFAALAELASAAGANGFTALDLTTEFQNPDAHASLRASESP